MLCTETGVLPGSEYFFGYQDSHFDVQIHPAVVLCGHYYCVSGYAIDRPWYSHALIAYIQKGEMFLEYGGQKYIADAGSIMIINCRKYHHFWTEGDMEFYWAHFQGEVAIEMVNEINRLYAPVLRHSGGKVVQAKLDNLITNFRLEQPISMAWQALRLNELIYFTYPPEYTVTPVSRSNQAVTIAVEYMKLNIDRTVSVDELATVVHMSRFHFSRIFRKETGFSPYEYLMHLRFNLAKYLLKTTDYTIKRIAFAVGYQSETGFANVFTEREGLPPGHYRKGPW